MQIFYLSLFFSSRLILNIKKNHTKNTRANDIQQKRLPQIKPLTQTNKTH